MLRDVVAVQPLPEYRLRVTFDDGTQGVVDVREMVPFAGVFQPLQDAAFFSRVKVNTELGTVCWPNDADLDSDVLSTTVTGVPVPESLTAKKYRRTAGRLLQNSVSASTRRSREAMSKTVTASVIASDIAATESRRAPRQGLASGLTRARPTSSAPWPACRRRQTSCRGQA